MTVSGKDVIVKADRSFFCQLVVLANARDRDLYDVYFYELGPVPWSNATPHGMLYKTEKSMLLEILQKRCSSNYACSTSGSNGSNVHGLMHCMQY